MPAPVLHKYLDFGDRAIANITLASGERVLLSASRGAIAIHCLYLRGLLPFGRLFAADVEASRRLLAAIARMPDLPALPTARDKHSDDGAMLDFMTAATKDLLAIAENRPVPGAVDALDVDNPPERPLSLITRLALAAKDAADLTRRCERARNIVA